MSGHAGKGGAAARILVDDYQTQDYRGFLLVRHETYGLMLLHCTRKKSKPPHWQLPGGHIDEPEFLRAAAEADTLPDGEEDNRNRQLLRAGQSGAARELFEETGIDVRAQLERLEPADLHRDNNKPDSKKLVNEYKHRLFFFLHVTDQDFVKHGVGAMGTDSPDCPYKHVKLRLSIEHSGFTFQKDVATAADMLKHHSGGKVAEAVRMAYNIKAETAIAAAAAPTTTVSRAAAAAAATTVDLSVPPPPERSRKFCCFNC